MGMGMGMHVRWALGGMGMHVRKCKALLPCMEGAQGMQPHAPAPSLQPQPTPAEQRAAGLQATRVLAAGADSRPGAVIRHLLRLFPLRVAPVAQLSVTIIPCKRRQGGLGGSEEPRHGQALVAPP